jgi:hypothetical protein
MINGSIMSMLSSFGNDHYHAMDQYELARFVVLAEAVHSLLGLTDHKAPTATETISRKNTSPQHCVNSRC